MLLPACSMVYLIALLCGGHLTAPPCIRSLPLLIWSLVHLPIILHMMEMHDTVEVSRGVGCETNMYLFPIVVDFVIDYLSIAEDIVPCDTHGPVVHPDGEELVLQARQAEGGAYLLPAPQKEVSHQLYGPNLQLGKVWAR